MSDIFLSYKNEDRQRAKIIAEAFERYGYSVWWDIIIPPGKSFDQVIVEKLKAAKCVIVLWSRDSVSSNWVKNEAREGSKRCILVPILIDDVEIPFEFSHIQAGKLIDWQGTTPNLEFELLLKSVEDYVGKPPALKKGTGQENEWQQHWEEEVRRQRKEEEERKERERKVRAEKERIAKEEEAKKEREKQKARQEEIRLRNEQEGKKQTPREKGTDYYRDSKAPIYIAIVIGIIVVSIVTSYTLKFFGFL